MGARADESPKVLAAIKFPPVKALSNELMGLTRQVMPGQQTEMWPMMLLGAYGYPNFAGVSETQGPTMFFFHAAKGDPTPYVILTKMSEKAAMRKALTMKSKGGNSMFGFLSPGLVAVDRDGWTLFSNDAASFEYVQDLDALAHLSDEMKGFDINARVFVGPEMMSKWVQNIKETIADDHVLNGGSVKDPALLHKQLFVEFLATIGENIEWAGIGLNITPDEVAMGFSVQAIEGAPEYSLLSAKAGGPTPIANYVARSMVSYVSNVDHHEILKYYEVLESRAMEVVTEEGRKWLTKAGEVNRTLISKMGDSHVGSIAFSDENVVATSAMSSELDNAVVVESMRFYYEELMPYLLQQCKAMGYPQEAMEMVIKADVAEVQNSPVNEIQSKIGSPLVGQLDPTNEEEYIRTEQTFFSVVMGNVLSSTKLDVLETLANNLTEEKPVADNIASRIQLANGQAIGSEIDVGSAVEIFAQGFDHESEFARQALKQLMASDLAPITSSLRLGDGQGVYEFAVPVSTIVQLSEVSRQIKQSEMEMKTMGGERPQASPKPEPAK
ncbi:hypothetical protein GCM10007047_28360 [Cerasicoccus arenae]|uniref:Uncharacterized protein n=3 Tax=Cerasicoccus arenae TaxID=424488 RepID=A0A8J3DE45_9BACT|nr:hypothetical protein GCM10007047_28360 [Cerasicoccus arenae]